MNIKKLLVSFVTVFAVGLTVSAFVTLLGNLIVHGASTIDWAASLGFAILFAIILSWTGTRRSLCVKGSRALVPGRSAAGQGPVE